MSDLPVEQGPIYKLYEQALKDFKELRPKMTKKEEIKQCESEILRIENHLKNLRSPKYGQTFVRRGYCKLCREKEIELYMSLAETDGQHIEACEMADCKHPPGYNF